MLIENADTGAPGTLNHLGVEVESTDEVSSAQTRLNDTGLETEVEDNVTCCYAVQDKVWVADGDKVPWEIYTVTGDADEMHGTGGEAGLKMLADEGVCCGTDRASDSSKSACC